MSAHRVLHDLFKAPYLITDPGDGETITVDRQMAAVPVVTAGSETRTLAQPTKAGLYCTVAIDTDGGSLALTVTGGWNQAGDTALTLGDEKDFVVFHSIKVGSSYYWRVVKAEGVAEAISEAMDIHALTSLAAVPATDDLVAVSDESATGDPSRSVTVTQLLTAAGDVTDLAAAPAADDRLLVTDESESGDPAKSMSVQNLYDGIANCTAFSGAVVPATDQVFLDDAGTVKKCTFQVLMDGIGDLTAAVIATTDTLAFIDATDGAAKIESVDDLFGIGPALVGEEAIADGDYILFLDGGATGTAKKEALADVATLLAGGGLTAASSVLAVCGQSWTMGIPGTWAVAGDAKGGNLAGCDQALDITFTEAAAAFAVVYDASDTYYPLATSQTGAGYAANYQLFPGTEAENDACFFGHTVPFCQIWLDVDTVATYNAEAASQIWEYSKGSSTWGTLTLSLDGTDVGGAATGQQPFGADGAIAFVPPADWAADTVNGQEAYWIRCRCTAAVDITQTPTLNSHEHYVCTPTDGFKAPANANITGIRVCDNATTVHSTADVKFFLMNFTKGTYSAELTFPQDKRVDRFDGTTLKAVAGVIAVDDGDILGIVVTQEDGTAEVTNAVLEIEATPL